MAGASSGRGQGREGRGVQGQLLACGWVLGLNNLESLFRKMSANLHKQD